MLDQRADSILYQGQGYLVDLVDELVTNKRLGKALEEKWAKADYIIALYEAYAVKDTLDDPDLANNALECIIELAGLYDYPAAPTFQMAQPPAVIVQKGDKGDKGDQGPPGSTGMATDIQVTTDTSGVIDSFPISAAKGVRWDYIVTRVGTGEQRAGSIIGTWSANGDQIDFYDQSTEDIIGPTDPISFDVQKIVENIALVAVITEGAWNIVLTRYFIPNNGNGTGPINAVLPFGLILIGNQLNEAQARSMFGDVTITYEGDTTISPNVIFDVNINTNANISWTKMLELTGDRLVITDTPGYITTTDIISLIELSYLAGATSNIQNQLNTKMEDPTTTVGDMIYRDPVAPTRLPIGTEGQVLTVQSGLPAWLDPSGPTIDIVQTVLEIGPWNMDNTFGVTVVHGLPDYKKILGVQVMIRSDADNDYGPLDRANASGTGAVAGGVGEITNVYISLTRTTGGYYDSSAFDTFSPWNRGWITITYRT